MKCPKCGKLIPDSAKFCDGCGAPQERTKFCVHCGEKIAIDCVVCPQCGKQVAELKQTAPQSAPVAPPQVVINNTNTNANVNTNVMPVVPYGRLKNKWVAFILCLFLGWLGIHKFYERKIFMGILYALTGGLMLVGVAIDLIIILTKPPYYY